MSNIDKVVVAPELADIVEKLATRQFDFIRSHDLGGWDGQEHWLERDEPRHRVTDWHIERLVQLGFIQGGHGGWRLSDAGRAAYIKSTDEMGDGKLRPPSVPSSDVARTLEQMPTDAVIEAICKWMAWDYADKEMRAEASELFHVIARAGSLPQSASGPTLEMVNAGAKVIEQYLEESIHGDIVRQAYLAMIDAAPKYVKQP